MKVETKQENHEFEITPGVPFLVMGSEDPTVIPITVESLTEHQFSFKVLVLSGPKRGITKGYRNKEHLLNYWIVMPKGSQVILTQEQ